VINKVELVECHKLKHLPFVFIERLFYVRFLIAEFGGDLTPSLWAGRALQQSGHSVTILSNPCFREEALHCSHSFIPVGSQDEWETHFHQAGFWKESTCRVITADYIEKSLGQFFEAITIQGGNFDALISMPLAMGANHAAAKLGKPVIMLHSTIHDFWLSREFPIIDWGMGWLKPVAKRLPQPILSMLFYFGRRGINKSWLGRVNRFRQSNEMAPVSDFYRDVWTRASGHAGLFPRWYYSGISDWPASFKNFNFPLEGLTTDFLPMELEAFLSHGPKPIVWTFGGDVRAEKYVSAAVAASQRLGLRSVIMSASKSGMEKAGDDFFYIQQTGYNHPYYSKLFEKCLIFVNHGGQTAITHCLAAGIPQLAMPRLGDQFDNAYMLSKRLRVGKVIHPGHADTAGYITALSKILRNSDMMERAKFFADKITQGDDKKSDFSHWVEEIVRKNYLCDSCNWL